MGFPFTIDATAPAGTTSPSLGDDEFRALKQAILDIFGLVVHPTQLTAAAFSIAAGGVTTFAQNNAVFQLGSVSAPSWAFLGRLNTGIYSSGAGLLDITATGVRVAQFQTLASGVNYLTFLPAVTGNGPIIDVEGTDTDISLAIDTKGTGSSLQLRVGSNQAFVVAGVASAVNFWQSTNAASGGTPVLTPNGTDTNISAIYDTRGTGNTTFRSNGTPALEIHRLLGGGGLKLVGEGSSTWGTAGANNAWLYLNDNGSGKTQLKVEFNTGGPVVIATEP